MVGEKFYFSQMAKIAFKLSGMVKENLEFSFPQMAGCQVGVRKKMTKKWQNFKEKMTKNDKKMTNFKKNEKYFTVLTVWYCFPKSNQDWKIEGFAKLDKINYFSAFPKLCLLIGIYYRWDFHPPILVWRAQHF